VIILGIRAHYAAIGGVENSVRNLVKVAAALNRETTIVCREPINDEVLDVNATILPKNVKLKTYVDDTYFSIARRLLSLMSGGVVLVDIYRQLYSKYPHAIVIARHHAHVLAAKTAGFKTIRYLVPSLICNQLEEESIGGPWKTKVRFLLHAHVDGYVQKKALCNSEIFVFSQVMKCQIKKVLGETSAFPITLVSPGIDTSRFKIVSNDEKKYLREKLGLPLNKKIFLFVGRLVKAKGIDYLIGAMEQLGDDCMAVLVGEGEQRQSLLKAIEAKSLEKKVIYVGRTSGVEDFYQACDVFVMSSTYEPLGQTLFEAAATGMRVVAFDKSTGVNTATHELNIDCLLDYAYTLDATGLALAMKQSLSSLASPRLANDTVAETANSWERLWFELIDIPKST
jgi:glycosyltransferase involved in cell wall biosynthesis